MKLEDRIKQLRKSHGYTMQELGDKANLTKGYISMLEKGVNPGTGREIIPSLETVQNLAFAFNLSIYEFLEGVETSSKLPDLNDSDDILTLYNQLEQPRKRMVYAYIKNQLDEQNSLR